MACSQTYGPSSQQLAAKRTHVCMYAYRCVVISASGVNNAEEMHFHAALYETHTHRS